MKPIPKWMQFLRGGHLQSDERNVQNQQMQRQSCPRPYAQPQEQPRIPISEQTSSRGPLLTSDQRRIVTHAKSMPALPETVDAGSESGDVPPTKMIDDTESHIRPLTIKRPKQPERVSLPTPDKSPRIALPANGYPCRNYSTGGKGKAPERVPPRVPTPRRESRHVS